MSYQSLINAYTFLNENEKLKYFVKNFNEPNGFIGSNDESINIIASALEEDMHSGLSFALTMRCCQSIFNNLSTLESYNDTLIAR